MFRNMCTYYKVPYFEFGNKGRTRHILGKQMRASLAVIDPNFSNALLKHFCRLGNVKDIGKIQLRHTGEKWLCTVT